MYLTAKVIIRGIYDNTYYVSCAIIYWLDINFLKLTNQFFFSWFINYFWLTLSNLLIVYDEICHK